MAAKRSMWQATAKIAGGHETFTVIAEGIEEAAKKAEAYFTRLFTNTERYILVKIELLGTED